LYYLQSRYYNPEWGRFINADSEGGNVGQLLSHNLFAYCMNNPVNMIDPSGHWSIWATIAVVAVVVAVVAIAVVAPEALVAVAEFAFEDGAAEIAADEAAADIASGAAEDAAAGLAEDGAAETGSSEAEEATCQSEGNCFVAGTLVTTQDGQKSIENIQPGDMVYSENPETGQKEYKQVGQIFVHEVNTIVQVSIGGIKLDTTEGHKFWVVDRGWVEAKDLKVGDKVLEASGKIVTITDVKVEKLKQMVKVYNFEVEDFHTYFVSNIGILVHNTCGENGTKVTSKTTWKNGKTERIDVENPAPALRPGDVHYHEPNNTKWRFDIDMKKFIDPKTLELAPNRIQKLLNNTEIQNGINKGLKILGEGAIKIFK
jgi:hypothetical protein